MKMAVIEEEEEESSNDYRLSGLITMGMIAD
jgi:hypothetical protein